MNGSKSRYVVGMMSREQELEEFKKLDLCQYAASRGFVLDRRQSSRSSAVLKHSNGDKLIVAKNRNGQFMYFNAKGNDNGTIIDFVQSRERCSLGEVRKLLRPWLNGTASPPPTSQTLPIDLQPSEHDAALVLGRWLQAKPIGQTHPYLETVRHIPRAVLKHPIFEDRIRIDARGNALFPHYNQAGLCGFETKNIGWTGFSPGGIKGLACSRPRSDDREMVICETFIDLLSYATLRGIDGKRLFSTAGQISPLQAECLRSAVLNMPAGSRVVLALDHDDGGKTLAEQIRDALAQTGCDIIEDLPLQPGDDWNDVLRQSVPPQDRVPGLS
ncbi:DUF3991 domain-containing protein [Planctomicrobium sp. SH668]|uniref:DUF3991 domain-containing protein n=1 Tax=Planctomicrobium sp. SH668 TaxID=3448126 RepID=UPI003F5B3814